MPVNEVGVELGWGPAKLSGKWVPDQAERDAAWELYVELVTRVAVVPLGPRQGVLREALSSLYALFGVTREILRKYGPAVARPPKEGQYRFGHLAVWMLNAALRPVLASWHPELSRWEASRPEGMSVVEHEAAWQWAPQLRPSWNHCGRADAAVRADSGHRVRRASVDRRHPRNPHRSSGRQPSALTVADGCGRLRARRVEPRPADPFGRCYGALNRLDDPP